MKEIKLLVLSIGALFLVAMVSCSDDSETNSNSGYVVAEAQLMRDYSRYNIGGITWSTQRGYQIAAFSATQKSGAQAQTMTAWYSVAGTTASLEMDSKDLGTAVPDKIRVAFEATKYGGVDKALWVIDEIELEHNYNNNAIESYYEMELESVGIANLEAELFFSYETGELLYSKEELDNDDSDDDKYVITAELKTAVEKYFPDAIIIDAEIDDNLIEVDAVITVGGVKKEIELEFTMGYELVSSEIETEFLYSQLPAKFNVVKEWFAANSSVAPVPPANTEVEITEGEQTEDDYNIGEYYYEVEIDDYDSGAIEYEVEFYLNKELEIIAVVVNDEKQ